MNIPAHIARPSPVKRRFLGLTVKVDCVVGMSPRDAFDDMSALAKKMNCFIESDFNGARIVANPFTTFEEFYLDYECAKLNH